VVVSVGLTLVDPLAAVDVNVPGTIEMLVAPLVTQLNVLLCPFVTLDGLAVNELIVGFVAACAIPLRLTQTRKVSRIKEGLAQHTATGLRSTASNCSFTAPEIFIFHPWIRYDRQFCGTPRPSTVLLNQVQENFTSAHFYITLMDFDSSASAVG